MWNWVDRFCVSSCIWHLMHSLRWSHAAWDRILSQMLLCRIFSTSRFGFAYLVYSATTLRSMPRLVCGTSSTLHLRSLQYISMALISGVAAWRNFSVRPSISSTSLSIIFAWCWGALSTIRQIFPNLRTAALGNLAKCSVQKIVHPIKIWMKFWWQNLKEVNVCEP